MIALAKLVAGNEDWLMARIRAYAAERGYTRYTSTLEEAWRLSVHGLSSALLATAGDIEPSPDLGPDDDFRNDPLTTFGVTEAQRHRERGIPLGMFLGLFKYYRKGYLDLVHLHGFEPETERRYSAWMNLFFDRNEIAFSLEWSSVSESERVDEMQGVNRALVNEKNKYLTFFESYPDPVLLFDPQGVIRDANVAARRLFDAAGVPGSVQYGKGTIDERLAFLSSELAAFRDSGEAGASFRKAIPLDGGLRHFDVKLSQMRDFTGLCSGTVVVLSDITGIVEARNVLTEEKGRLETVRQELLGKNVELNRLLKLVGAGKREWEATMDCIDDMVVLADAEGRVRRCNQPFHNFSGSRYEELAGRRIDTIIPEIGFELPYLPGIAVEQYHEGSSRWFVLHKYTFEDQSAYRLSGIVVTIHDTTELKLAAHAVELKNRELKDAMNVLKETQSKILQQEKMASIGQLAAGVAHEINNPIGFVSSNLTTLRKYAARLSEYLAAQTEALQACATPDQNLALASKRKSLKIDAITGDLDSVIKESIEGTDRVGKIVLDLKTFSRVDEAAMKPADLNRCIESTLNIVWNELKYKTTLVKDLAVLPPVFCYPQQINQVIMNLLVNAAHAIETLGTITVRSWAEPGWIAFSIADTGCGISPESQRKIFEPFFTTKEVGKGTGLGLSITYDIVQRHKGEIAIESVVGRGTTFTVKIPFSEMET